MTLPEFKAWFDGFTENMAAPPNKKQWARIQERVAEIDGTPGVIYVDRGHYNRMVRSYLDWGQPLSWSTCNSVGGQVYNTNAAVNASPVATFGDIGRADFDAMQVDWHHDTTKGN